MPHPIRVTRRCRSRWHEIGRLNTFLTDLLRTPAGDRVGKSRAPSAVGRTEANGHASTPPLQRPTVLDPAAKCWPDWRSALIVVQPDTVVRWHRQWLRRRWARLSQRRPGRRTTNSAIRALVSTMTAANPLWGDVDNTSTKNWALVPVLVRVRLPTAPPTDDSGSRQQQQRRREQRRRDRPRDEHHRGPFGNRQRAAQLLFGHRSQDHADDRRRKRDERHRIR